MNTNATQSELEYAVEAYHREKEERRAIGREADQLQLAVAVLTIERDALRTEVAAKTYYEVEAGGIRYIVAAGKSGWLRQITPSGEDGGTIFPPFQVVRILEADEVANLVERRADS